jgi:DNA repair protein RadC
MYVRELVVSYRRVQILMASESRSVSMPREAASVFASIMGEEAVEVFGILCLTSKYGLIAYHQISRGGIGHTVASPREVFQVALLSHAAAVIVGHNHPSGDPRPSADDRVLTERLVNAGKVMGVEILDHIIVGHDGKYFSFKEGGGL